MYYNCVVYINIQHTLTSFYKAFFVNKMYISPMVK